MKTSATAKFIGTSARKTGLAAALIRGRRATDAQTVLLYADQRAAGVIAKVLASAIANAENNHGARVRDLVVESVLVGPAKPLKRSRPRAKGSSSAILKRSSHVTVVVSDGQSVARLVTDKAEKALAAGATPVAAEVTEAASTKPATKKEAK